MRMVGLVWFLAAMMAAHTWAPVVWAGDDAKSSAETIKKNAGETFDAAKKVAAERQEEYRKKLEAEMDELSKKIGDLKDKAAVAKGDAAKVLQEKMAELKVKQKEAEQKMGELRASTAQKWEGVKAGAEKAVQNLKKAYELLDKFNH